MAESAYDDVVEYHKVWVEERRIRGYQLPRFSAQNDLEGGHPPNWFLGPKAENLDLFLDLLMDAVRSHEVFRRSYHPDDGVAVREADKLNPEFLKGVDTLRQTFGELLASLRHDTTPYYSWRYQGHMLWDTTLPAMLGYFATMLHNPNNVTIQASTLTTFLEQLVGWDLCGMLGFPFPSPDDTGAIETFGAHVPHGHLTSGGTVANIESAWAAREVKFLPVLVHGMLIDIESPLYWYTDEQKQAITVMQADGATVSIMDLDQWQLLNVRQDSALSLPRQLHELGAPLQPGDVTQLRWRLRDVWNLLLANSVNELGIDGFYAQFLNKEYLTPIGGPVILGPVTWHYSWPKAAGLLGLGSDSGVMAINVDPIGRMDTRDLRLLLNRAKAARQPVVEVVAVLGSTEESAVDDLEEILAIRDEYRAQGFDFNVHVDAAWGGYFAAMLRRDYDDPGLDNRLGSNRNPFLGPDEYTDEAAWEEAEHAAHVAPYPIFASPYVLRQIEAIRRADSATVDPHKTGYVPYPAGAITYRNGEVRRLVAYGAPVIGSSESLVSVGEYGVEGSKPGASAAAVYLSHAVVRPSHSGHGRLMNASLINARLFYAGLLGTNIDNDAFVTIPLVDLDLPGMGWWATDGAALRDDYRRWLDSGGEVPGEHLALLDGSVRRVIRQIHNPRDWPAPDEDYRRIRAIGPDLNVVDYMFNFRTKDGSVNDDLMLLNRFNREIYNALHVPQGQVIGGTMERDVEVHDLPLLVTKTEIHRDTYGDNFCIPFLDRLGVTIIGPGRTKVREILSDRDQATREPGEQELDCYRKLIVSRSVVMDPFLHAQSLNGPYYVDEWMHTLRRVVRPIAEAFRDGDIPPGNCGD